MQACRFCLLLFLLWPSCLVAQQILCQRMLSSILGKSLWIQKAERWVYLDPQGKWDVATAFRLKRQSVQVSDCQISHSSRFLQDLPTMHACALTAVVRNNTLSPACSESVAPACRYMLMEEGCCCRITPSIGMGRPKKIRQPGFPKASTFTPLQICKDGTLKGKYLTTARLKKLVFSIPIELRGQRWAPSEASGSVSL